MCLVTPCRTKLLPDIMTPLALLFSTSASWKSKAVLRILAWHIFTLRGVATHIMQPDYFVDFWVGFHVAFEVNIVAFFDVIRV